MPRERSKYRDKRSSSHSSESSLERKRTKTKHKRRSRDRSESSSRRRKRSSSRSKYKKRSYSRSLSREKYEGKSRRPSSSRSRSKARKHRSYSRSSSRGRTKYSKSSKKLRRRSSSSSNRSNSFDIEPKNAHLDDTETKVERAIKAAAAAGLTMTKIPIYEYKDVEVKEDMPTIHDRNLLDEINCESFVQKPFTSSRTKKEPQNIVIDLNAETVKVPQAKAKNQNDDSIINFDEILSQEELKEMWIRKLFLYRKKMLKGDI